jgi:uncharacterized pyridoxamine 5'-phosphate oxidase family protein
MEFYVGTELADRPVPAKGVTLSSDALEAITGRYDYNGAIMSITRDGPRLFAQLGAQPRFEIFPKSETEFFWKVVDAQVTFVKDANGRVKEAIHHQNGNTIHAPRLDDIPQIKLTAEQTDPFLGSYTASAGRKLTISRQDERLYAQLTGQPKFELVATSENEFFLRQVDARLTFVKDANGAVTSTVLRQAGHDHSFPKEK